MEHKEESHDSRDVDPEDGTGFVTFMIEVEEDLMRTLVEQCLGVLKIGATEGRLTGSGMVAEVRAFLGMNDENEKDTWRTRLWLPIITPSLMSCFSSLP